MNSGYYQFLVAANDQHKTAFLTKLGLFEFRGMAMGLCNAPATFQRAMQLVFRGMTWREILSYLDDLNVIGKSFEDHLSNLRRSFKRIRKFGLKLKPRKCCLFQTEVPFLGKLVSRQGVSVHPNKIKSHYRLASSKVQKRCRVFSWIYELSSGPHQGFCRHHSMFV